MYIIYIKTFHLIVKEKQDWDINDHTGWDINDHTGCVQVDILCEREEAWVSLL